MNSLSQQIMNEILTEDPYYWDGTTIDSTEFIDHIGEVLRNNIKEETNMDNIKMETERQLVTKIKKLSDEAVISSYAKDSDAGLDLTTTEEKILEPMERYLFSTKLSFEIEKGYYGSIRGRSGLAVKHGIHTLAGVVDSGYRGEVKVCLINLNNENVLIEKGDRIAQMIIQPCPQFKIEEITELSKTERGEKGFGSTGN